MADKILSAILIFVGVIHVVPVVGVFGMKRQSALYAITITDPNIEILMRHRAVLFGVVGALLIYSAFHPRLQGLALLAAFFCLIPFVWLMFSIGGYNIKSKKVVAVDLVAIMALLIGAVLFILGDDADWSTRTGSDVG
jgi:hypothetical protein